MSSYIYSIVLGIVEGFTEFLPISSTAHLVLVSEILKIGQTNFTKTFEIAIQSGAILAVIVFYWRKFIDFETLKRVIVAFIPTGIIGLLLYKFVREFLLGNISVVLWALALGGIVLILFEKLFKEKASIEDIKDISYGKAVIIGVWQSVAIIPGVSRSAATIIGGMIVGVSRKAIVEFSFLLAVPTMFAATSLDILNNYTQFSSSQFFSLGIGLLTAFVTAVLGIKFFLKYIKNHSFVVFGIYRIILVVVFILFLL